MHAPSHVLVVLLCFALVACCVAASLLPSPLGLPVICLSFSTGHPVQCDVCLDRGLGLADGACGWAAGVAGFGVFFLPGFGLDSTSPMGDAGVNND